MVKVKKKSLFVVAKCAQTADGKIATATGQSKWITSSKTRKYARLQRDKFDAILVGMGTVIKDNPRLNGVKNKNLKKIVIDSSLRISPTAKLFQTGKEWIVATTKNAPLRKRKLLENRNIKIIECPRINKKVNLKYLLERLQKLGIQKILIEGGPTIIGAALKDDIIDQIHIYLAPKIMGDIQAKDSINGFKINNMKQLINLNFIKIKKINKDILVVANVHRNR